jgi:2-dehydropantoate 2-reductase
VAKFFTMKTRIGVLGIGGVGGYFGGLLAKAYSDSNEIEIVFIARGETQKAISQNGLKIISPEGETVVFPNIVSNNPEVIGKLDFLICATKTYDIEESLDVIKNCITENTIILPLYNGVDATDRIARIFPETIVLQGCVYIVSMIVSPGVIQKIGNYNKLFFGSKNAPAAKLNELQEIFKKANIESYISETIEETVWEKFVFISTLASATTFLNQHVGEILDNTDSENLYFKLLHEIVLIAVAKNILLPNDIIEKTVRKLEALPPDATSSMHRDFLGGRKIELASLTGYVVNLGFELGVATPTYQMILDNLSER